MLAIVDSWVKSRRAMNSASCGVMMLVGVPSWSRRRRSLLSEFLISQCGPRPRSVRVMVAIFGLLSNVIADWMDSGRALIEL